MGRIFPISFEKEGIDIIHILQRFELEPESQEWKRFIEPLTFETGLLVCLTIKSP